MERLAYGGRRDRREPVRCVWLTSPSEMGDLAHERGTVRVDALREPHEVWDDRVGPDVQLAKDIGRIGRDVRGAAEHGERDPALRLLLVVGLVALLRQTVDLEAARMAGAHHPVL